MLAERDLEGGVETYLESRTATTASGLREAEILTLYNQEVDKIPTITPDQVTSYARALRDENHTQLDPISGEELTATEARRRFVEGNLGLVRKYARQYLGRGVSLSDLIQAGNEGLQQGVVEFDPDQGTQFSTYGKFWILKYLRNEVAMQGRSIAIPPHEAVLVGQVARIRNDFWVKEGREPTDEEIAGDWGESLTMVKNVKGTLFQKPVSLEDLLGITDDGEDQDYKVNQFLQPPDWDPTPMAVIDKVRKDEVSLALATLSSRQRYVLERLFEVDGQEEENTVQIAETLGISKQAVSQIRDAALRKLRAPKIAQQLRPYL